MIVVTIDLVPAGLEARRRTIASLRIANAGDVEARSDYSVDILEAANPIAGTPARIAACRITDHDRNQPVWALIGRVTAALENVDFVEL
jgi:hypothetical protein